MNLKKIIFSFLLIFPILTEYSYAKSLPPGTGEGDVPANILIMLDRSGSMGVAIIKGSGFENPSDIVANDSGKVWGLHGSWDADIKKVDFDTDSRVSDFGNDGMVNHSLFTTCDTFAPSKLEYWPGGDKVFYNSPSWWTPTRIIELNAETGTCDETYDMGNGSLRSMEVHDDKLYVALSNNLKYVDLNTGTINSCSWSGHLKSAVDGSEEILIDSAGDYFLVADNQDMHVFEMNGNCPKTSRKIKWNTGISIYSAEFHPDDDDIIYFTTGWNSQIHKWEMDGAKDGNKIKSIGTLSDQPSTASTTYTYMTTGITVDGTNNRVYVANSYKHGYQAFNFDLEPIIIGSEVAERGGSIGSRMDGAHQAIRNIVLDSSLQSKVNFGFAWWAAKNCGGTNFGYTSWNASKDQANPCSTHNCLKVRINDEGFEKIDDVIDDVNPVGCTDANAWATIAQDYYTHNDTPIDDSLDCQNSYIIVIGDGAWSNHNKAKSKVEGMLNGSDEIKTFTMAYGGGISGGGLTNFRNMAISGGTNDVIMADTPQELTSQLKSAVSQIIADNLSFTAPSISANIEEGGSMYQASYKYNKNKQWDGTITRTKITAEGAVITDDPENWDAETMMPGPDSRNIWTHFQGEISNSSTANINNFTRSNSAQINSLFNVLGRTVTDYHRETAAPSGSTHQMRCFGSTSSSRMPENDIADDIKGLISFVRGEDYFDYDGDCNLIEERNKTLGDIYHSEIVRVGKAIAETAYVNNNQEAYYRSINGYDTWASGAPATRQNLVYAGGNDGMIHAFNAITGAEEWAFVPPFMAGLLPDVINPGLNLPGGGGSNAIYGIDGSITVHDMYFWGMYDTAPQWHTIMLAPFGRGGAGFTVLDITNPNAPFHMYSIFNDKLRRRVMHMTQDGAINEYPYSALSFGMSDFEESKRVLINKGEGNGTTDCDNTPETDNNYCYTGKTFTLEGVNLINGTFTVTDEGDDITANVDARLSGSGTIFEFSTDKTYNADPVNNTDDDTDSISIQVNSNVNLVGTQSRPEYDYSKLGETWSSPRIFRMPNLGAGDDFIGDDKYVAVMGGGYGGFQAAMGSQLLVIDLVDAINPGQALATIPILDTPESNIVNSVPNSPVVITADSTKGINFTGALVYINDFEGKITKVNLTNMSTDGSVDQNPIALYDTATLFVSGSSKANGRYMFHSMDATIGGDTKQLWLFAGTGNYHRINDVAPTNSNILVGIKDVHYPNFKKLLQPEIITDRNLTLCSDVTNDGTGALCPDNTNLGWVVYLENGAKVTNEPTVSKNKVYFPIYEPQAIASCDLGNGYICAMDDECGTNNSNELGSASLSSMCHLGGSGVISKVVVFADKIFANIAGQNEAGGGLISADAVDSGADGYRSSWRENY